MTSHSSPRYSLSSADKDCWNAESEKGIEFNFWTPKPLARETDAAAGFSVEMEVTEPVDGESFNFLAEGSGEDFPWELENMSTRVRWRLRAVPVAGELELLALFVVTVGVDEGEPALLAPGAFSLAGSTSSR